MMKFGFVFSALFGTDLRATVDGAHLNYFFAQPDFTAQFFDLLRVFFRNRFIINDSGVGYPNAFQPLHMRLDFAHFLRGDFAVLDQAIL